MRKFTSKSILMIVLGVLCLVGAIFFLITFIFN